MKMTAQFRSHHATKLNFTERKALAIKAIQRKQPISQIAKNNKVSRKFIYHQHAKAIHAVNDAFETQNEPVEKIIFSLPVTARWLCQLILCLVLHCRGNYRGIQKTLRDAFDYDMSIGKIHNIILDAKIKAHKINMHQDLSSIKLAAQDELFHHNKPAIAGVDIPSLYCYLLSYEDHRDADTWGIHLLDLQKQGFNPTRVIADDAGGLRAAHQLVFPDIPCDADHFHIIKALMDMRRYFRNRLKTAITNANTLEQKLAKAKISHKIQNYSEQINIAKKEKQHMHYLSQSIDTLVNWMQHDVLNKPGSAPEIRHELFDFILSEFKQLAQQHPHRIQEVCTTLENQKHLLLAFTGVLNEKFKLIADQFKCPLVKIWQMCELQRCQHSSDAYAVRSLPLQDYFQNKFDEVEDAVFQALDATERTSSIIENLNSRLSSYFFLRREIGHGYLDLLRFYFNHVPFQRSAKEERIKKSPAEILNKRSHPHWLEMLGYERFKKAA